jgi:hypothetical protein
MSGSTARGRTVGDEVSAAHGVTCRGHAAPLVAVAACKANARSHTSAVQRRACQAPKVHQECPCNVCVAALLQQASNLSHQRSQDA